MNLRTLKRISIVVLVIAAVYVPGSCCVFPPIMLPKRDIGRAVTIEDDGGHRVEVAVLMSTPLFTPIMGDGRRWYLRADGTTVALGDALTSETHLGLARVSPDGTKAIVEMRFLGVPQHGIMYDANTRTFSRVELFPPSASDAWEQRGWQTTGAREAKQIAASQPTTQPHTLPVSR